MSRSLLKRGSIINPVIEDLQRRRLLSADLTGAFSGAFQPTLHITENHYALHVLNEGDAAATGNVTFNLFASPDGDSSGSLPVNAELLDSVTRNINLQPGRNLNVKFHFAEPTTLDDGVYSLFATIDTSRLANVPTSAAIEAPMSITVNQPTPDLASEVVTAPSQPIVISGADVSSQPASVSVKNEGNRPARGEMSVNLFLSADRTLDSGDVLAGSLANVPVKLKPGQTQVFSDELAPPVGTPAGSYYLIAQTNPGTGIMQRTTAGEVGVADALVQVLRPTNSGGSPDTTPTPSSSPQPIIDIGDTSTGTTTTTGSTTSTGDNSDGSSSDSGNSSGCDDGDSSGCDTGDSGSSCEDGSDSGNTSGDNGDDGSDDNSGTTDDGSQDNSSTDDNGQNNSNDPSDGGQDDSGASDNSTDNGDNSTDDNGSSSDSGDDGSADDGSDGGGSDDSGSDDGSSGDDSGDDSSGDDSSGDDGGGDFGDDAVHVANHGNEQTPIGSAQHQPAVGSVTKTGGGVGGIVSTQPIVRQ